jgi:outer membrane protein
MSVTIRFFLRVSIFALSLVFIVFPARAGGTIASLYQQALIISPEYAAAKATYASDILAKDLAKATLFPVVNLTASADSIEYERRDLNQAVKQLHDYSPTSYAIRLTQSLYNKERSAFRVESALRSERAEFVLATARAELLHRVVQTALNYLLAVDQQGLAGAQAMAVRSQLTQLEALLASRTVTRTEVADARARYEAAVAQERVAASLLEMRRNDIVQLTGQSPPDSFIPLTTSLPIGPLDPAGLMAWTELAVQRHPKLAAQRLAVQMAEAGVERARAANYPSVVLTASRQRGSSANYFTAVDATNQVGVQMNMTLFDGGGAKTQVEQALLLAERARQELRSMEQEVNSAVLQAYWGVVNGELQIAAMEQSVEAASIALDGTRLGIKASVKTYADELVAVQNLYGARRDLQKERYTALLSRVGLAVSSGAEEQVLRDLMISLLP